MRRILIAAFALAIGASPSFAADNYSATAGTGLTFAAKNVGGVLYPWWIPSDSTGAAFGVTGNPFFVSGAASAFADGWDLTQGTKADAAWVSGSGSVVAILKNIAASGTTTATNTGAAIPTQAPTVSIGGVGIIDSAGTNVATVKAASTLPAATDKTLVVGLNPGTATAGTPTGAIISVQGVSSGTPVAGNTAQVNGVTVLTGTGATGTGAQRVTVSTDQATNAGAALVKGGVGVVSGGSTYQAVAASQTATVLQTSTGAIGDYLSHCTIYPTSTSPGVVTVFDNTNAAATSAILFPGGASSLSNLVPFTVPVGAISVSGAWKVTTGTAVSVVCYGKFS